MEMTLSALLEYTTYPSRADMGKRCVAAQISLHAARIGCP